MLNSPFAPWPSFTQEEADAAARVLLSNRVNYWTGTEGREFEREFAAFADAEHAIALTNGTVALDLALHGLGVGSANGGSASDEVVVTPRTFLASVSSVVNAGAVPVFADVDPDSGNIEADTIAPVITERTRAIVVVHLAGWPADMDAIMDFARPHGIKVIEDCAQAHGARYKGRSVGSIGDVGAWSFCQDKIMTTGGEGGMVTCNDEALWRRMWSFKDHGKSWEAVYEREHPPGFRWLHEDFGTNWRMTEVQAVIGRIQLDRMGEWTERRNANAAQLIEALTPAVARGAVRVPRPGADRVHADYKFYAYVDPTALSLGWDRDRIVSEIVAEGVPCFQGSCSEVYLEKAFEGTGWRPDPRLPNARALGETSLMWLVHPTLTEAEMALTAKVTADVLDRASS
ncbi:DegT/DnrJ/EryC1/StrS family aminotransferase [Sphingomicrobium aestuariivivum]|uniref:DegT/DnrJ/EryC1/StrS family aminotransferase n=1 Tax=Sphingomicrobium aestuariivivum TaxID=1582356 RepID=UPI001FD66CEB|nr:DegT/DnrJ/EryC1/StrS aminotransferase family protein [Sphingomicrobium aestuariivivum]MCJ8191970.1 DegT/DnrJ/EryC1/StrS aminotransferase family protein [Sphingomicrobium aestuariivivum]